MRQGRVGVRAMEKHGVRHTSSNEAAPATLSRRTLKTMRSSDQLAAMSCPVCRVQLAMSDRQGIEIDYCPQCRGVWLDRGELDKIIERSQPLVNASQPAPQPVTPTAPPQGYAPGYQQPQPWSNAPQRGHYKKRKSWLEEIFD